LSTCLPSVYAGLLHLSEYRTYSLRHEALYYFVILGVLHVAHPRIS